MTYEQLYNEHSESLLNFLSTMLKNKQDIEDISQDTWMSIYQQFDNYDQSRDFYPWMIEISKNLVYDMQKSFSKEYEIPISNLGEEEYSDINNILYSIYEDSDAN